MNQDQSRDESPMARKLESFLRSCADGCLTVDEEGNIHDANQVFLDRFGYPRDELLNLSLAEIEAGDSSTVTRSLSRIAATGKDRYRSSIRQRAGGVIPVEINATSVQADKERFYLLFISDRSSEEALGSSVAVERELTDHFVRSANLTEYLAGIVHLVSRWCGCRYVGIRVLDWSGNIPYAAFKGFDPTFWEKENWLSATKDQCICPRIIMQSPDELEVPGMTPGGSFICNHTVEFGHSLDREQLKRYRGSCWKSGLDSLAIVPLRHQGKPLGGIQIADEHPGAISQEKIEFIETLTPLISVAIQHYNTEDELRQNYDAQMVASLLARISLENLSPDELASRALEVILSIPWLPHDESAAGSIFLKDSNDSGMLRMAAQQGLPASVQQACGRLAQGDCWCGLAAEKQELVFTDGSARIDSMRCQTAHSHGHYCVPIVSEARETLGVINVHVREGHRYSEREEQALTSIANTLAIGIQRKEAERALQRRTAQAESLVRTAGRLNTQLDMNRLLRTICEEAVQTLGAAAASVALYKEEHSELYQADAIGLPHDFCERMKPVPYTAGLELAIGQDQVVVIPDLQQLEGEPAGDINADVYRDFEMRTAAVVTLRQADQIIGSLSVYSFRKERLFSEVELGLLKAIADQASLAINNALQYSYARTRLNHIVALRAIDMAIAATMDLRVILSVVVDQVAHQLGVDAVDVLLLNPHTQTLDHVAGRGFRSEALKHTPLQMGQGYGGRVALERHIIGVPDMTKDESLFSRSPRLNQEGFIAYHGVPLVAKGRVQGVLEVFHRHAFKPDSAWLEFLEAFAGQAAIAIDNAGLFSELQQSNTELSLAYDATLEGWSHALDLRDKETEGHTQRVTEMTMRLARIMGIGDAELAHVRRGALLHDIGKMGIPDHILLKQGPLTPAEWEVMHKHPGYALDLLAPISYLRQSLDIPYCHHEKWDGSGYPRGLKREQIPLTARIFSVVDVWDALSSDRPYRAAWPPDRVINHLRTESGKHFDPQVVEAFLDLITNSES